MGNEPLVKGRFGRCAVRSTRFSVAGRRDPRPDAEQPVALGEQRSNPDDQGRVEHRRRAILRAALWGIPTRGAARLPALGATSRPV